MMKLEIGVEASSNLGDIRRFYVLDSCSVDGGGNLPECNHCFQRSDFLASSIHIRIWRNLVIVCIWNRVRQKSIFKTTILLGNYPSFVFLFWALNFNPPHTQTTDGNDGERLMDGLYMYTFTDDNGIGIRKNGKERIEWGVKKQRKITTSENDDGKQKREKGEEILDSYAGSAKTVSVLLSTDAVAP